MDQTITAGQAFNPFTHFRLRLLGEAIIPADILNVPGIRRSVARTYAVLAQHAGWNGKCFPKIETVAELVGLSYRQVSRHIRILIDKGLLALRHQQRSNGWYRSNEYFFVWHESFSAPQNVRWMEPKMSERKDTEYKAEQTNNTTNGIELRQPPAERGRPAANPERLIPLRDELQHWHNTLPGGGLRYCTYATRKTASRYLYRISQALGRAVDVAEGIGILRSVGFGNYMAKAKRRRKAPLTLSGIIEYAYNFVAPPERQTFNYNPGAYLPMATDTGRGLAIENCEAF